MPEEIVVTQEPPKNFVQEHRMGQFSVSRDMIFDHPEEVLLVMASMVVIKAEIGWGHEVRYIGFHPAFDIADRSAEPPFYFATMVRDEDGTVHFGKFTRA